MSAKSTSVSHFSFQSVNKHVSLAKCLTPFASAHEDVRKRNQLRSAEVPFWVIRASLDSRPAASTCRSEIVLNLDWTSFSFWGTEYRWPTKKNSETFTITSSGAGRLQRTCVCQWRMRLTFISIYFLVPEQESATPTSPALFTRFGGSTKFTQIGIMSL